MIYIEDGDGFEILDVEDGVYFDEDNVDLTEKTQWVDADDALLAMDLNGDGVINDGSELFGSSTVLADGSLAKTGFEALAQYDSNGDMVIDEQDEKFSEMLLWQDGNTDGISQANELYTLEKVGVESISLNSSVSSGVNSADVTMADGAAVLLPQSLQSSRIRSRPPWCFSARTRTHSFCPRCISVPRLRSVQTRTTGRRTFR